MKKGKGETERCRESERKMQDSSVRKQFCVIGSSYTYIYALTLVQKRERERKWLQEHTHTQAPLLSSDRIAEKCN